MTKKRANARLPQTLLPALALALSIAFAGQALSQGTGSGSASPGTAGAGNAAAANDSLGGGGGGPPTMPGTGPSTTSPGGINGVPEARSPAPPAARPNQVPDTAGATNTSTTPPGGTVGMATGRMPGHTGRVSTVQESSDPVVEETEKEVSKRIKNICRGC